MLETLLEGVSWTVLLAGLSTGFILWYRYPDSGSILLRIPIRIDRLARIVIRGTAYLWVGISAVLVVLNAAGLYASGDSLTSLVLGLLFWGSTHLGLKTLGLAATADGIVWSKYRIPWADVRDIGLRPGIALRIATSRKAPRTLRDSSNPTVWRFKASLLDIRPEHVQQLDMIRRRAMGTDGPTPAHPRPNKR